MASSGVLVLPPARRISGSASNTTVTMMTSDSASTSMMALRSVALAASRRSSPLRRATMAVTPTLRAKKTASIIIRGCVGRETPAMAFLPSVPTIMVSAELMRLTSTISATAGSAMRDTS